MSRLRCAPQWHTARGKDRPLVIPLPQTLKGGALRARGSLAGELSLGLGRHLQIGL